MAPGATNSPTSQQLYESLPLFTDQESGTIRVLDLRGDGEDAPLAGTLRVIRLPNDDFFAFSALSYVWGQRRFPPDTINCNGCDLPITASCHDALRALRVNHGPITIWVDAICINQANMGEKAAQIPLMPEIYSSATPVYIYLGQGSELFSQALKVVSTASELKDNDIEIPESVDKSEISHRLSSNIETMETMAKDAGIDVRQIDLDCEWLHRAWTWQEIMLAAHPLFLWGTTEISWKHMLDGISFLKATEQEGIQAMNPFQSPFGGESDTSTKTFISPFYDVLAQWSWKWTLWIKTELAQSEGLPSSYQQTIKDHAEVFSFFGHSIMNNLRTKKATNSYDHIYSLYGVLRVMYQAARPAVDYEQPLHLAYMDFFTYITTTHASFLHLISDSGIHQALQGAPSWLPDWSKASEGRTWLSPVHLFEAGEAMIPSDTKEQHMNTDTGEIKIVCGVEGSVLSVSAAFHCRLTFCSTLGQQIENLSATSAFNTPPAGMTIGSEDLERAARLLATFKVLHGWLEASSSMRDFSDDNSQGVANLQWIAEALYGYHGTRDKFDGESPLYQPDAAWALFKLLSYIRHVLELPGSGEPDVSDSIAGKYFLEITEVDQLKVLEEIARSMVDKREVFVTENGEVGSGPPMMEVGDRIAYIAGVGVPMALRAHEPLDGSKGRYSVIGPICFCPRRSERPEIPWAAREIIQLV